MRPILASLLLASVVPAQAFVMTVNDPKSHGTLGDAKLSLDEAIQIVNLDSSARPAFLATMSPSERAQVVANPLSDDLVVVDAATVPTITYEREITPIVTGIHQHQDVAIEGIGEPTLDAKTYSAAFPVRTNHAHISGFKIVNGKTAVEADTTLHYHPGDYGEFADLHMSGQTEAGIRFPIALNPPGQSLPFKIHDCHVHGDPIGLHIDANTQYPSLDLEVENCHFENCVIGCAIDTSTIGGVLSVQFFRTNIVNSSTCVQVRRTNAASDCQVFVRTLYGEYLATHHALDIQGSTLGETIVHTHQAWFRGGPDTTDYCFRSYPKTARFDLHSSEMTFEGNISILGSRDTKRIFHHVNRYVNGTFALDNDGVTGIPDFQWNVFESFPMTVGLSSKTPFNVQQCEFVRSPIADNSIAGGAITLTNCFRAASPMTGAVTETLPATARWLGRATVAPLDPPVGTFVDLTLDYQPGMLGAWLLGTAESRPKTTNYPYRFYFNVLNFVSIPGVYQLRDNVRIAIPNSTAFVGVEFFAQPIASPSNPQPWQTVVTMPAGGRFIVR